MQTLKFVLASAILASCAADRDGGAPAEEPGAEAEPHTDQTPTPRVPTPLEEGLDVGHIQGNVRLFLTDAPGDFDEVWVDVGRTHVALGAGEDATWTALNDQPTSLDLLTLQDDVTAALGDANLEPGHYGQLRFLVNDAFVVSDGESEPLTVPSGAQTGIKLNLDFDVEPDKTYALVLDFDAQESIRRTGAGLRMQPVILVEYIGEVNEDGTLTPLGGADTESATGGEDESTEEETGENTDSSQDGDTDGDDQGDEAETEEEGESLGDAGPSS